MNFKSFLIFFLLLFFNLSCRSTQELQPIMPLKNSFIDLVEACQDFEGGFFNSLMARCICQDPKKAAYYSYNEARYVCGSNQGESYFDSRLIEDCLKPDPSTDGTQAFYQDVASCVNQTYFLNQSRDNEKWVSSSKISLPDTLEDRSEDQEIVNIVQWLQSSSERVFPLAFLPLHERRFRYYLQQSATFVPSPSEIRQVSFDLYVGERVFTSDFKPLLKQFYTSLLKRYYFPDLSLSDDKGYKVILYEPIRTLEAIKKSLGVEGGLGRVSLASFSSDEHPAPSLRDRDKQEGAEILYTRYREFYSGCAVIDTNSLSGVNDQGPVGQGVCSYSPEKIEVSGNCLESQCVVRIPLSNNNLQSPLITSRSLIYVGGALVHDFLILETLLGETLLGEQRVPYGMIDLNLSKGVSTYHLFSNVDINLELETIQANTQVFDRHWNSIFTGNPLQIAISDIFPDGYSIRLPP